MRLVLLLLLLALAAGAEPERQIDWVGDWDAAFKLAKKTDRPVMLCINSKDGEGANERAANDIYRDPEFVALSRKFVMVVISVRTHWTRGKCPRFGKVTCQQHLNCWKMLRNHHGTEFAASAMSAEMISPQHAWFRPDGTLLRRKEYELSKLELMKRMNKVLKDVKKPAPENKPEEKEPLDPRTAPLTEKEKAELKRVETGDKESRRAALSNLLATEKIAAHEALVQLLRSTGKTTIKCDILRALGRAAIVDAREVIEDHLKFKDALVRSFAAVALEEFGSGDSIPALLKRAKTERDTQARKNMYRALGVCGGGVASKDVASFLLKRINSDKQASNKKHAAISLRSYTSDAGKKLVVKRLERLASKSKDRTVRGGIVYTLTKVGNAETTLKVFQKLLEDANNDYAKRFMRTAIRILKGEGDGFGRSAWFLFSEDRDDPARQD